MKVIDFHVHPPFDAEEKGIPPKSIAERILEWMDKEKIDVAVLMPIAPYISNDYIAKIIDYDPERLMGFASVIPNPADKAIKEIKYAVKDLGLRGLKLHPGMQGFCLRNPHVWRVIRFAGEIKIPVVIHTLFGDFSTLFFKSPPGFNRIEDYELLPYVAPETTLILAHMGGSFHFEDALQIASNDNVYVDTSYSIITITMKMNSNLFGKYVESLGSDKFLFGSDYVLGLTPNEYGAGRQIEIINSLPISDRDRENILHKNAERILDSLEKY